MANVEQFSLSLPPLSGRHRANSPVHFSRHGQLGAAWRVWRRLSATYGWISWRSGRRRRLFSSMPRSPALACSATQLTLSSISSGLLKRSQLRLSSSCCDVRTSQPLPCPPGNARHPVRSKSVEWASRCNPPPYTVWGARGRSASRHKQVDLKRLNKPPAAASSGRSWYTYQKKESFPQLVGSRRAAKAYLSISEMLSPPTAPYSLLGTSRGEQATSHLQQVLKVRDTSGYLPSELLQVAGFVHTRRYAQGFPLHQYSLLLPLRPH